jgi:MoaD family protein
MPVHVQIPTILQNYTGGQRSVQASGTSLAELLAELHARYPGLRARLLTEDGRLQRFMNIYINDEDIRSRRALDSSLTDGDVVTIIPAVAGGSR